MSSLSVAISTGDNGVVEAIDVNAAEINTAFVAVGEQITFVVVVNGKVEIARAIITGLSQPANAGESWTITIQADDPRVSASGNLISFSLSEPYSAVYGYAVIRSAYVNGQWKRSTSTMTISTDAEAAYFTADAMNVAVQSWDTNANTNMLSNWYLNLSDTVYDGADVVISVATSAGGRTKVRARMVNIQGELIPYIYTTDGTSAGYCITQSGARSSVTGSQITGAIGFVQWGSVGNSTGNNTGSGGSSDPVMP
ncbi:MAG: hypothetical protein IJO58_06145 [Clostridia bacterium]|nr:hypothetical protein [Clostridia bacterium]